MSPGARSPRVKKSPPGSRARRKGQAAIYNSPAPHCPTWRPSHGRAEVKAIPGPVTAFGGRLGGRGVSKISFYDGAPGATLQLRSPHCGCLSC